MKVFLSTVLASVLLMVAGAAEAASYPIHRNGLERTYSAAYQDALSQAGAACDAIDGVITSVEVTSAEMIFVNWHVSIFAICEV